MAMSRRFSRRAAFAVLALSLFAGAARAQTVTIKMATLVPEGSSWHTILKEVAEKWKTISGGRVVVKLYAGGVAGDDPDVVRKMRLGTLNAGVLTSVGLGEIDKSVYALGVPMMYESYDELYGVLDQMRPTLEQAMLDKGFVSINWVDAGWVHFFAKKPIATPADLKAAKLFAWAGDIDTIEVLKSGGFRPVPLPATEISTALQTGLVEALGTPPQVAVISQYFVHAPYMTDLDWQLLLGGTVVKKETWDKIPAELHAPLLEAAREAGRRLQDEIRASAQRDVEAMQKRGLKVVPVDAKARAEWLATAESFYPKVRGTIVPAPAFDLAMKLRNERRAGKPAAKP
jgi:TRAP-type C4-dicarboxylate transport system substrate-binding protein